MVSGGEEASCDATFALFCDRSERFLLPLVLGAQRYGYSMAQVANEIRNSMSHVCWAAEARDEPSRNRELRSAVGHVTRAILDALKIYWEERLRDTPPNHGLDYADLQRRYVSLTDGSHRGDHEARILQAYELLRLLGARVTPARVRRAPPIRLMSCRGEIAAIQRLSLRYAQFSAEVGRMHRQAMPYYVAAWRGLVGSALGRDARVVRRDLYSICDARRTTVGEVTRAAVAELNRTTSLFRAALLDLVNAEVEPAVRRKWMSPALARGVFDDRVAWAKLIALRSDLVMRHRSEIAYRLRFRNPSELVGRAEATFNGLCWIADLADSSRLAGNAAERVLSAYVAAFRRSLHAADRVGAVVACNTWGDGVMVAFNHIPTGIAALRRFKGAIESSRDLADISVRVGVAVGSLRRFANPFTLVDVTGPVVVRAARLEACRRAAPTERWGVRVQVLASPRDADTLIREDPTLPLLSVRAVAGKDMEVDGVGIPRGTAFDAVAVGMRPPGQRRTVVRSPRRRSTLRRRVARS